MAPDSDLSGDSTHQYDAFISYRRQEPDKAFARDLLARLEKQGYTVAFDERDFRANENFLPEMERCIKESRYTLCLLSPRFFESGNCEEEPIMTKVLDMGDRKKRLVPLTLEAVELPTWLYGLTGIRFDDDDPLVDPYDKLYETLGTPLHPHRAQSDTPRPQPVENLPYRPMSEALFKGRQDSMAALMEHFDSEGAGVITQPHTIHGLGGVGKTRLAVEYAWKAWDAGRYDMLLFIAGDTPESLMARVVELAQPKLLALPEYEQGHDAALAAVFRRLHDHHDWLLIIDNIDTEALQEAVKDQLLPRLPGGRVLMTSRLSNWWDGVHDFRVDQLSEEDGAAYLMEKTNAKRSKTENDEEQAKAVSRILDGLPVALEQAGAYINRLGLSFGGFLEVYENSKKAVLGWDAKTATNHPLPVLVMWEATEAQLGLAERAILRLLSFLAPTPVPVFLFEEGSEIVRMLMGGLAEETGKSIDNDEETRPISESMGNLAAWSMLSLDDDHLHVHRLVQDVTRLRIPKAKVDGWKFCVLTLLNTALPNDPPPQNIHSWVRWHCLEQHVKTVIDLEVDCISHMVLSSLMNNYAVFLQAQIRHDEAEVLYRRTLRIDEESYGVDHPNVVRDMNNLGLLLKDTNRLKESESLLRRALALADSTYGVDHPNVASILNGLGALMQLASRLDEAELLYRRALKINTASFERYHPSVGLSLNNLAQLLQARNRLSEAEPLIRRALEIGEASDGSDHPNVAIRLNNLAQLLQVTNRMGEAEPLMRRALEIDEASYGNDHPDVARDLKNLAQLLQATNRMEEAEPLLRRALVILVASLGSEHPKTHGVQRNLNCLLDRIKGE